LYLLAVAFEGVFGGLSVGWDVFYGDTAFHAAQDESICGVWEEADTAGLVFEGGFTVLAEGLGGVTEIVDLDLTIGEGEDQGVVVEVHAVGFAWKILGVDEG
jgi:hypothetical protein